MRKKYIRKFLICLICGRKIVRGKYCKKDKKVGYELRSRQYNRSYYLLKKGTNL